MTRHTMILATVGVCHPDVTDTIEVAFVDELLRLGARGDRSRALATTARVCIERWGERERFRNGS